MSRKSTCAISSSISFLPSAAIWIHMETPDPTILSSRLPRVERKARPPCAGIFAVQRPGGPGDHAALVILAQSDFRAYRTGEIFTVCSTVEPKFCCKTMQCYDKP